MVKYTSSTFLLCTKLSESCSKERTELRICGAMFVSVKADRVKAAVV